MCGACDHTPALRKRGVRLELVEVRFPGALPERGHRQPDYVLAAEKLGLGESEPRGGSPPKSEERAA